MSFPDYLTELMNLSSRLSYSGLTRLSNLPESDALQITRVWLQIEPTRRKEIISRLAEMTEDNVSLNFTMLFELGMSDIEPVVRIQAILGLWECEDRHLIELFCKCLMFDPSDAVRAVAAEGLGRFCVLGAEGKLLEKDLLEINRNLLEVIQTPVTAILVRQKALEAIAPCHDDQVTNLIDKAYMDHEITFRHSAIYAMGRNGDARWLPYILKELRNADPAMRYEAVIASGQLGQEKVVPVLVEILDDGDMQINLATIDALGSIGGTMAKNILTKLLESEDQTIKDATRVALDLLLADEDPLRV